MLHYLESLLGCSQRFSSSCRLLIVCGLFLCTGSALFASPAGTQIVNVASVDYTIEGTDYTEDASVGFQLDQVLDLSVLCQTTPINVFPGEAGVVSTFLVANTGNGPDTLRLSVDNTLTAGDDYDPTLVAIWLDNGDGVFNAGTDTLYSAGSNDPQLAIDESIVVFVQNDIPSGLSDGDEGQSELSAVSVLQGSPLDPVGTVYPAQGVGGVNAIVGQTQAADSDVCVHRSIAIVVSLEKSNAILPQFNTDTVLPGEVLSDAVPGAIVTYTLAVSASGMGTAEAIVISDLVPAETTYIAGSLALDSASLTDATDSDEGEISAGQITVRLPDMNDGDSYTITFNALIE